MDKFIGSEISEVIFEGKYCPIAKKASTLLLG